MGVQAPPPVWIIYSRWRIHVFPHKYVRRVSTRGRSGLVWVDLTAYPRSLLSLGPSAPLDPKLLGDRPPFPPLSAPVIYTPQLHPHPTFAPLPNPLLRHPSPQLCIRFSLIAIDIRFLFWYCCAAGCRIYDKKSCAKSMLQIAEDISILRIHEVHWLDNDEIEISREVYLITFRVEDHNQNLMVLIVLNPYATTQKL